MTAARSRVWHNIRHFSLNISLQIASLGWETFTGGCGKGYVSLGCTDSDMANNAYGLTVYALAVYGFAVRSSGNYHRICYPSLINHNSYNMKFYDNFCFVDFYRFVHRYTLHESSCICKICASFDLKSFILRLKNHVKCNKHVFCQ